MSDLKCENCCYHWKDPEYESRPSCHFPGDSVFWPAPCEEDDYPQNGEEVW